MRKWPLAGVVGLCGSRWKTVIRVLAEAPETPLFIWCCVPPPARHKDFNATNSPQAGFSPRRPTGRQCCSSLADGNKTKSVLLNKFFYQTEISCFFFLRPLLSHSPLSETLESQTWHQKSAPSSLLMALGAYFLISVASYSWSCSGVCCFEHGWLWPRSEGPKPLNSVW